MPKKKSTPKTDRTENVKVEIDLVLQPERSFPFMYHELAKGENGSRCGIHAAHQCLYFFIGKRVVSVPMGSLINAISPEAHRLAGK